MFRPKPISKAGIPLALQKAERYRVINDPSSAESICLDVLTIDPDNEQALVTLLLAITDQFGAAHGDGLRRAKDLLPRLRDGYRQAYYAGIIAERFAKAQLHHGGLTSGEMAYHGLREAMGWYEKAESQCPAGNDEAILRWNTCARILAANPHLQPRADESMEMGLE